MNSFPYHPTVLSPWTCPVSSQYPTLCHPQRKSLNLAQLPPSFPTAPCFGPRCYEFPWKEEGDRASPAAVSRSRLTKFLPQKLRMTITSAGLAEKQTSLLPVGCWVEISSHSTNLAHRLARLVCRVSTSTISGHAEHTTEDSETADEGSSQSPNRDDHSDYGRSQPRQQGGADRHDRPLGCT